MNMVIIEEYDQTRLFIRREHNQNKPSLRNYNNKNIKCSRAGILKKPVSQSCAVTKSGQILVNHWTINLVYKWLAATRASKVWFLTHSTALWPVEQSSILSAKFDCPVACQNFSLLAIVKFEYHKILHQCHNDKRMRGVLQSLEYMENRGRTGTDD